MGLDFSIIMPVYNGERFIEDAIQSIIQQNIDNYELIIIDDGSTDKTGDVCKKFVNKKIKYIKTVNKGAGHARNIGIKKSKGDWILFIDCDDLYLYGSFSNKFVKYLKDSLREKIDIIYTSKILSDMTLSTDPVLVLPEKKIINYMPEMEFWTCIYRREFLLKNKIKFYEYKKQDIESAFRFQTFYLAKKIVVNPDIVLIVHRENLASNVNTWKLNDLYEIKSKVYYDLYLKYGINKQLRTFLYTIFFENYYNLIYFGIKNGITNVIRIQIKDLKKLFIDSFRESFSYVQGKRNKLHFIIVVIFSPLIHILPSYRISKAKVTNINPSYYKSNKLIFKRLYVLSSKYVYDFKK